MFCGVCCVLVRAMWPLSRPFAAFRGVYSGHPWPHSGPDASRLPDAEFALGWGHPASRRVGPARRFILYQCTLLLCKSQVPIGFCGTRPWWRLALTCGEGEGGQPHGEAEGERPQNSTVETNPCHCVLLL